MRGASDDKPIPAPLGEISCRMRQTPTFVFPSFQFGRFANNLPVTFHRRQPFIIDTGLRVCSEHRVHQSEFLFSLNERMRRTSVNSIDIAKRMPTMRDRPPRVFHASATERSAELRRLDMRRPRGLLWFCTQRVAMRFAILASRPVVRASSFIFLVWPRVFPTIPSGRPPDCALRL